MRERTNPQSKGDNQKAGRHPEISKDVDTTGMKLIEWCFYTSTSKKLNFYLATLVNIPAKAIRPIAAERQEQADFRQNSSAYHDEG